MRYDTSKCRAISQDMETYCNYGRGGSAHHGAKIRATDEWPSGRGSGAERPSGDPPKGPLAHGERDVSAASTRSSTRGRSPQCAIAVPAPTSRIHACPPATAHA